MPAKSQKQAVAARIARGVQKGEVKPKAGSASAEMAKMSPEKLKHFMKTDEVATLGYGGHDIGREDKFSRRITNIKDELAKMGFEIDFIYHRGGDEEPMKADIVAINKKTGKSIDFTVEENKPKLNIKNMPQRKIEKMSEAVVPKTYQSAIAAVATDCIMKYPNCDLENYTPAQVIAIVFDMDPVRMEQELKKTYEQKLQKAKQRGQIREGKCSCCGGDGWYIEPDEKGEPTQVQCNACRGQGGSKDPEPRIRASGEPENEPFFENNLLGDMAKTMMGKPKGLAVNGKTVDESSVEIENIDRKDYPDFVDAFVSAASFEDGTELNDAELDEFNQKHGAWINEKIHNDQLWM